MSTTAETAHVTGAEDKDYTLIWFLEHCLANALRLESYASDAERDGDQEIVELFRRPGPTAARAPRWPRGCRPAACTDADSSAGEQPASSSD